MRSIVPAGREATRAAGYSPGVLVAPGLLFVAGHTGTREDGGVPTDPQEQFVALFERMAAVLAEAGAGFEALVDMTSFHVGFEQLATFMEVKSRYLVGPVAPAWTAVGVSALGVPGALVEVKATASLRHRVNDDADAP